MSVTDLTYFDGRIDADYYMADIDGVIVHIKCARRTYAVTPGGEVYFAYVLDGALCSGAVKDKAAARQDIPRGVRSRARRVDVPTIGTWVPLRHPTHAVACPVCGAPPTVGCYGASDGGQATVLVVGAPYQPEPSRGDRRILGRLFTREDIPRITWRCIREPYRNR